MKKRLTAIALALLVTAPAVAGARGEGFSTAGAVLGIDPPPAPIEIAQRGCMTLSQAIASVKRSGNVKQVISAETRNSGGREVHHIKVLTTDGKVKTHRIQGC